MRPHISTVPVDYIKMALGHNSVGTERVILAARNGTFRGNCAQRVYDISRLYIEKFLTLHSYVDMGCCQHPDDCDFARSLYVKMETDKKRLRRRALAQKALADRAKGKDGG